MPMILVVDMVGYDKYMHLLTIAYYFNSSCMPPYVCVCVWWNSTSAMYSGSFLSAQKQPGYIEGKTAESIRRTMQERQSTYTLDFDTLIVLNIAGSCKLVLVMKTYLEVYRQHFLKEVVLQQHLIDEYKTGLL